MIFARRALQRRLDELRDTLSAEQVDNLVGRLNRPGRDRMAAMWEVVILHGLAKCGTLRHETPLPSGKKPDVSFDNDRLCLMADITCASDDGLDEKNPYDELSELIEKEKGRLGLPVGGVDLQVKAHHHRTARGSRTVLRLPPRNRLRAFVHGEILPRLREQMAAGKKVLQISLDSDEVGIDITIDPARSPYSGGGYASYDIPRIKDRNRLYYALAEKIKTRQLRGAQGLAGIIVGDGNCAALRERLTNWDGFTASAIAKEFLRQYSSVDFVLLLTIREQPHVFRAMGPVRRWVHPTLIVRPDCSAREHLCAAFNAMLAELPKPIAMPVNAARRAREPGYDFGHHGGGTMGGNKIRVSSRELIEVLAGVHRLGDNAKHVEASRRGAREVSRIEGVFLRNLMEGRLPAKITVNKTDEDDADDWIEFEFGDPDPAISPLR